MIVFNDSNQDAERVLPLIIDGNLLRCGLASSYMPSSGVQYYAYAGGKGAWTLYGNPSGKYNFQPSNTAPGQARLSENGLLMWKSKPVEVLASTHFSPDASYLPTVAKNSGGYIATAYCDYSSNLFAPFEYYDASHPAKHDVKMLGSGVTWDVSPDGLRRAILRNAQAVKDYTWFIIKASSWFLLLASGTVNFSTRAIKNNIYSMYYDGVSKTGDNTCSQETTVTEMLRSGSLAYYLVKTTGLQVLRQESPFSGYENFINNPKYIDWPKVLFTLGSSSSVVATSWGTDIWIHQYG